MSNATNMGHPQELWQWLRENAPKAKSDVRSHVGTELVRNFGSYKYYYKLDDKLAFAEKRNTELMQDFARKHMPNISADFTVKNPWLRMFECDVSFR